MAVHTLIGNHEIIPYGLDDMEYCVGQRLPHLRHRLWNTSTGEKHPRKIQPRHRQPGATAESLRHLRLTGGIHDRRIEVIGIILTEKPVIKPISPLIVSRRHQRFQRVEPALFLAKIAVAADNHRVKATQHILCQVIIYTDITRRAPGKDYPRQQRQQYGDEH